MPPRPITPALRAVAQLVSDCEREAVEVTPRRFDVGVTLERKREREPPAFDAALLQASRITTREAGAS